LPFMGALFYFLINLHIIWKMALSLEILSYFNCFLLYYFYQPLFSGLVGLVFLKTTRFMIHKWLQNNKQKLSNNQKHRVYKTIILFFKFISKWYFQTIKKGTFQLV
jgi:hypothetical protein